jgi:hypothetical protein
MITFRLKKSVGKSEMVSFEAATAAAAFVEKQQKQKQLRKKPSQIYRRK